MKSCPQCKRTYADDGFTFCLEDGALLSAPFDPEKKEKPISTIQSGGPPPTAVLPLAEQSTDAAEVTPLAPTIAGPAPDVPGLSPKPTVPSLPTQRKMKVFYLAVAAVTVLGLGYLVSSSIYWRSRRNCAQIGIECVQTQNSARCYLTERNATAESQDRSVGPAITSLQPILALQGPALPQGIKNVNWSVSRGRMTSSGPAEVSLDTTGLGQLLIIVHAKFERDSWICPTDAETFFVVQREQSSP